MRVQGFLIYRIWYGNCLVYVGRTKQPLQSRILNVDDKARDDLSVTLPELEWKEFTTPLWEGWRQEIAKQDSRIDYLRKRYAEIPQEISILRSLRKTGEITEYEFEEQFSALKEESVGVYKEMWHR